MAADATYWRRQEEGWFWYRDPPPVRSAKSTTPPVAAKPPTKTPRIVAHEALKARLEQALATAYINPTEANVRTYLTLQTQAVAAASTFADAWQKVVWATHRSSTSRWNARSTRAALEVYDREHQAAQIRTAEQLARTHVLFFLFRSDCPYCQQFRPAAQGFEQKFGLPVFAISLDGGTLPEISGGARRQRHRRHTQRRPGAGALSGLAAHQRHHPARLWRALGIRVAGTAAGDRHACRQRHHARSRRSISREFADAPSS